LKKVIIIPDSFKGVLTAKEAADIIASAVSCAFPDCKIIKMPIADGGEGSVDAVLSVTSGEVFEAQVLSPDNRHITAAFGITNTGTAVLEMAQSSGITKQLCLNPMTSNTFGFGQLILATLDIRQGDGSFIAQGDGSLVRFHCENRTREPSPCAINEPSPCLLCIGGSATTDGGCGMAAALGVKFTDKQGNSFIPCGETLIDIADIDMSNLDERIKTCTFTVMCDVDNPLYGPNGAAYIFGPQKGANPEQVRILDAGLRSYSTVLKERFGRTFNEVPGAGAAGGLGAGCMAFLGATLKSGIDTLLELYNFKELCKDADIIITGEGKLDLQSFQGKVLSGIIRVAGTTPVWSICGTCDCDPAILREKKIIVFQASEGISIEESMNNPIKYLKLATKRAMDSIPQDR